MRLRSSRASEAQECSSGPSAVDSPEVTLELDCHDFRPRTPHIPPLPLCNPLADALINPMCYCWPLSALGRETMLRVGGRSVGYGPLASSQQ